MMNIFLLMQTWNEFNKTGLDETLVYVSQTSSMFIPFLLFTIVVIVSLGIFYGQKRITGKGDFFTPLIIGNFVGLIFSSFLSLKEGIINSEVIIIQIAITAVLILLFFLTKE